MEVFLENRNARLLEEVVFLRWRRVTLQAKAESLQCRMVNIVGECQEATRQNAAALAAVQEQMNCERRRHQQAVSEQNELHTQVLESHSVEVEALRLMVRQLRAQATEMGKVARRWERLAKTFRPAQACLAVPPSVWGFTRELYSSEKTVVAMVLAKGGSRRALRQVPYSTILQARERLEWLLLEWVNSVMEKSPLASSWVPLEKFMQGHAFHQRSILVSQKSSADASTKRHGTAGTAASAAPSCMTEFGVYTLMVFIRELRRQYALAGIMPDSDTAESRRPSGDTFGDAPSSVAQCFREVVQLLSVQTCAGLYPCFLTHCPSLSRWFKPEVIFCSPTRSTEGARKERQLQHMMFVWLLTTLLVGHVRLTILAPAGEKDDGCPPPALNAVGLRVSGEADLNSLPQLNFPVETAVVAASPGREGDANNSTSGTAEGAVASGTAVVAQNTLVSKKVPNAAGRKASETPGERARSGITRASATHAPSSRADDTAALLNGTVTLETALRERCQKAGADLTEVDDSLSDIQNYLGLLSAQSETLRKLESNREEEKGAARWKKSAATEGGDINKDDSDDDLVNGLLQQLVEARNAAAHRRRIRRLQSTAKGQGGKTAAIREPASAIPNEDSDVIDGDAQRDDGSESCLASQELEGRESAVLTEGQLRILRSLPSRSCAFDTMRPIPPPLTKKSLSIASMDDASALAASEQQPTTVSSPAGPSEKFHSFLLNMLEDVTRRQQWVAVARIVTSLVVRFHILCDAEDGGQRLNKRLASQEAARKAEFVFRPSFSRPQPPGSLLSSSTSLTSSATWSQSSHLPAIASPSARDAAEPTLKNKTSVDMPSTVTAAGGLFSACDTSRSPRVAARLVPSWPQPSPPPPRPADTRGSNSAVNDQTLLHVSRVSVGEDFFCATQSTAGFPLQDSEKSGCSARDFAAPRTSVTFPPSPQKSSGFPLLSGHEMRVLEGEMRMRGRNTAATSDSASNSPRASTPAHTTSVASPQKPWKDIRCLSAACPPLPQQSPSSPEVAASPTSQRGAVHSERRPRRPVGQADHKEGMEVDTRPESASRSTMSIPREAGDEVAHEQVNRNQEKNDTPTLKDAVQLEPTSNSSLVAPPSPLGMGERKGTMQPSAFQPDGVSRHPAAPSAAAVTPQTQPLPPCPPQHVLSVPPSQHHSALPGPEAVAPIVPLIVPTSTGPAAVGVTQSERGEGDGKDDTPRDQIGYLDPLIEHGPPQSSAAIQNIRKDRFDLQH